MRWTRECFTSSTLEWTVALELGAVVLPAAAVFEIPSASGDLR